MPPPTVPEEAAEETTPALLEEILEQIFLRLPVNEPACLVRASLASKFWLALLTSARFRSRYREHHGPPPMLGFLNCTPWDSTEPEEGVLPAPPFVSTATGFCARVPDDGWGHRDYTAWDCRHGRVLLGENNASLEDARRLAVWDPMTGRRLEVQEPEVVYGYGLSAAAVLCAVSGCDHLACSHDGPFRVVHLSIHRVAGHDFIARVRVSSVDFVEWSDPCPGISVGGNAYIEPRPPVLLNGALHFLLALDSWDDVQYTEILKYDLGSHSMSLIDAPEAARSTSCSAVSVLMAMEDGNLGFAHLKELTLFTWSWSRHMGSDGAAAWTRRRVIDIKSLQPIQNPTENARLLGSMERSDVVFVATYLGIYKLDTKSLQHKKISNGEYLVSLIPYTSFNNPREKGETL